jgi:SAM-dependent methyltransferase
VPEPYLGMADYYDAFWGQAAETFGSGLGYLLQPGRPLRVLDLCCGSGVLLEVLAHAGHRVSGLDISPAMLDRARHRLRDEIASGQVELIEGDASSFELGTAFDLVTCSYWSLHELPPDTLKQALAAVVRHLAPSGVFAAHVMMARSAHAVDGVVTIENDAGGVATRIFLLTPEADRLQMFHRGYGRTGDGLVLPFTFRVALHLHDWPARFQEMERLGLTHIRLLSFDAARGQLHELERNGLSDQRDLVFVASRRPIDWGDRLDRLSERLRAASKPRA